MTFVMTQPAPEFPDADILSLDVDLAEVTAEMPALVPPDEARSRAQAAVSGFADDPTEMEAAGDASRAREALEESQRALLRQAAEVVRAGVAADEMLRALFGDIREPMGVDAYFNFLVNDAGDALALATCSGVSESEARSLERIEFGQALSGNVALKRAALVVADVQSSSDRRVQIVKQLGIRAVACHPLLASDRLLGTLSFASRTRDAFGPEDVTFFSAIARIVALSHERSRLARELAVVDGELNAMGRGAGTGADSAQLRPAATSSLASSNTTGVLSFAVRDDGTAVETRSSTAKEATAKDDAAVDVQDAATVEAQAAGGVQAAGDTNFAAAARDAGSAAACADAGANALRADAPDAMASEASQSASAEPLYVEPAGAEVILFSRYVAASGAAAVDSIPLGLIEAAPVSALEVSPLALPESSAGDAVPAETPSAADTPIAQAADQSAELSSHADVDSSRGGVEALETTPDSETIAPAAAVHVSEVPATTSPAVTMADATVGTVTEAEGHSSPDPLVQPPVVEEASRDEVLALALAAGDAPTLEVLALALTVDDPPPQEGAALPRVESEITVELCALDANAIRAATEEGPALDLSSHEIAALDLRPVETIEVVSGDESTSAAAESPVADDDQAPTVEVKALAIQELEAERAPVDDGEDITFTYVPPT